MFPELNISIANGRLGRITPSADGVAGLVVTGVSTLALPLNVPKQIFSLKEAETLGITATYDSANGVSTHQQIKEFYSYAGEGAELNFMLVAESVKMAEILDKTVLQESAQELLEFANGRIRLLGVSVSRQLGYTPELEGGMDEDVLLALAKGHALASEWLAKFAPFHCFVDVVKPATNLATLSDLTNFTYSHCSAVIASLNGKNACIGALLGWASAIKTVEKVSKRRLGAFSVNAYLTNGVDCSTMSLAQLKSLASKGYLVLTKQQNQKGGFYWGGDSSATAVSDDFSSIARNRVINKAVEIAFSTYAIELDNDVEILSDGKIDPVIVNYLQNKITRALNLQLVDTEEASFVDAYIDPSQNILSTDELAISLMVTPRGYTSVINITLGYNNPNNQ